MANGGSITWVLDVDDKEFNAGIDRASNKAEGASKTIGGGLSTAIKGATTASLAFAGALTGVGVGLGVFLKSASNEASEFEKSMITLGIISERFGQSASKTQQEAKKLGQELRIGVGPAAEGLQNLLKSGLNLEQSTDLMRRFTNEAITGKSSNISLADAVKNLSFAYATGNSALGNMSGISENFIDITERGRIALEKEGMARSAITDEMAKYRGMLDLTNLTMGASAKFQGTLTDTQATFAQKISELKVGIGQDLNPILNDMLIKITEMIPSYEQLTQWLNIAKDNIPILASAITVMLIPALISLITTLGPIILTLGALALIGAGIGFAVQKIVEHFGGWDAVMKRIQPTLDLLASVFRDWILPLLLEVWEAIQTNLVPALQRLWTAISPVLIPVLKVLAVILGGVVLASIMGLIKALEWSIKIFSGVVNAVSWFVEKVVGFFKWLYNVLVGNSIIPDLINGVVAWFAKLPNMIMSALSGLKNAIVAPFRDALQGALNLAKDMADKIRSTISKAFDIKKRNSPSILDRLNTLKDAVSGTLESIQIPTYSSQISSNLGGGNKLAYSTSTPNFTVNIGTYAGTDMEKRELARQIFEAYDDYAKSRGFNI